MIIYVRGEPQLLPCCPLDVEALSQEQANIAARTLCTLLKTFCIRPVYDWELSTRAMRVLTLNRLITLHDVQYVSVREISNLQGFGLRSMLEVYSVGKEHGYTLDNWLHAADKTYQQSYTKK